MLFWCLCRRSDCCHEGPWARPGRAVALRAVLSTRPPTPTRGGQARHRGGGGGRRATAAVAEQGRPLQVPQRGRRRSLRSLPAPTPGAPPWSCRPTSAPFCRAGPAPPSPFRRAAWPPRRGHPSATRMESGRATRPCSTPPRPPQGGWDKINDDYRISDLTIIV